MSAADTTLSPVPSPLRFSARRISAKLSSSRASSQPPSPSDSPRTSGTPELLSSAPLSRSSSLHSPHTASAPAAATPISTLPYPLNPDPKPYVGHTEDLEGVPLFTLLTTYLSYAILILTGHVRDFLGLLFNPKPYAHLTEQNGYAPIISQFESLYTRRLYYRIRDCFSRPVTGVPGRTITVLDRTTSDYNRHFHYSGQTTTVLNLSSYNYLGFAQSHGSCADAVEARVASMGDAFASPRQDGGSSVLHREVEEYTAHFVGSEAAIVVSMGYATNSTTLPALVGKGCLIISDELNHASLVAGARLSGAIIRVFKHNDVRDLEALLKDVIAQGQPRTHRPWRKILVVVEGLYSMEGDFCDLPGIVALRDRYKFYLYLDEAHSIGAMGPSGRGMCDYFGIPPSKVDVLMGTFTKSFGAAGGYIAGSAALINHLRTQSHSSIYAEPVSIPVLQQVLTSLRIIAGEEGGDEGRRRIAQLADNARYFHKRLRELGFMLYGSDDSPVVPLLLFHPAKIGAFSRECLKRGIAVVVVSYPATPVITSRVRFCLSASHTRADLDRAIDVISEVGDILRLKLLAH